MKTTTFFLLLAFFLSGCGLFAALAPTPAAQQPVIVVVTVVAPVEQASPTAAPPVMLTPTFPPVPTVTVTLTPVFPVATAPYAASSTPTYTPWAITQNALEWGVSPDQRWVWALEPGSRTDENEYLTTHFASQDNQAEWRVQPRPDDPGHPRGTKNLLRPLFWMPNEPYVFLAGESCCTEGPAFFTNGRSLYRLNLETGQFSLISPWGPPTHYSYSPGAKYQLIAANGSGLVSATRLQDSQTVQIPVPGSFVSVGNALWAPDGRHVLLRACDVAEFYSCRKTPLIVVDPEKPEFQTMVSDLYQALEMGEGDQETMSWDDNEHVRLSGPKYALVFDVVTGELVKVK
ncbi:MAG: hypothetical protein EHM21_15800 [Chloroflexi bacterium]|nr:MAG: hypothetical protein EHM21_15800 [Chloroflexota bacterium]